MLLLYLCYFCFFYCCYFGVWGVVCGELGGVLVFVFVVWMYFCVLSFARVVEWGGGVGVGMITATVSIHVRCTWTNHRGYGIAGRRLICHWKLPYREFKARSKIQTVRNNYCDHLNNGHAAKAMLKRRFMKGSLTKMRHGDGMLVGPLFNLSFFRRHPDRMYEKSRE